MRKIKSNEKISPGLRLKRLLLQQAVVIPGVYDALSAHLAKDAGFQALYLTGAGLSVSVLGRPDIGLLTLDEVAHVLGRITKVIDLPVLVDADTGFGGVLNVERTVHVLERAGAAGIQIEDQVFPKRCGHLAGKQVVPIQEMVAKIKMAVASRRDPHFLIVARTDARAVTGLKDALKRAEAYKKAGADIIFPEALESDSEFKVFGKRKTLGLLLANMTEFGRSPALSVSQLARLGFRLLLYPMTAFRVSAYAMKEAFSHLRKTGETQSLLPKMQTRAQLYDLIQYRIHDYERKIITNDRRKSNSARRI